MTEDSSTLKDAYLQAQDSVQEAGQARQYNRQEISEAVENIADSLDHITSINRGLVDSQKNMHEKLNDQGSESDLDEEYIVSSIENLLSDTDSGSKNSPGFDTWSNYNFGTQIVGSEFSSNSNYNFGTQIQTPSAEAIDGELVDSIDQMATSQNMNSNFTEDNTEMPTIYNPQTELREPDVTVNVGEETAEMDFAS